MHANLDQISKHRYVHDFVCLNLNSNFYLLFGHLVDILSLTNTKKKKNSGSRLL